MPVGIVAAGAVFIEALAAGLARRFAMPETREGLRVWLPHAGLKAPLGKALAKQGWVLLPEMEVLNVSLPLAVRLGLPAPRHANPEAELAVVAQGWRSVRGDMTPVAAVTLAADYLALRAQLVRAQTGWDEALSALFASRPLLAPDVAKVAKFHDAWLDGLPSAVEAAQARLAGLAALYERGLKAPVVIAGFDAFTPVGLRVAKAVAADGLGWVVVPDTVQGRGLVEVLGEGEVWEAKVQAVQPVAIEADDGLDEAWAVAMLVRDGLAKQQMPVAVVAEDSAVAMRVRDVLESIGIVVGVDGVGLAETEAGRLACAAAQAAALPTPVALASLLWQPLLRRIGGWDAAASALELALLRGPNRTPAWAAWRKAWKRLRKPEVVELAAPAWEALAMVAEMPSKLTLSDFAETLGGVLDGLSDGWKTAPGGFEVENLLGRLQGEDAVPLEVASTVFAHAVGNMRAAMAREHIGVEIVRAADVRLRAFGKVIVAGCNAGCWPSRRESLWFGQAQLAALGLPNDALNTTVAEADWQALVAQGAAFTRAKHGADGVESVASPLWQQTFGDVEKIVHPMVAAGRAWRRMGDGAVAGSGALVPGEAIYPRVWSASLIEDMRTCPYRALARRVMRLEPLPAFDEMPDRRELGILFHAWMERLPRVAPAAWSNADMLAEALMDVGLPFLDEFDEAVQRLWRPRMPVLAAAIATELLAAKAQGRVVESVESKLPRAGVGGVDVSAKADRVDAKGNVRVVIDYKTGQAPALKAMGNGTKPQLPIEAWLMEQAGHENVSAEVWRLKGYGAKPLEVVGFASAAWRVAVEAVAPGVESMAKQFAPGAPWQAWPHPGKGGVLPSGHCEGCALAGVCRFQERAAS